MKMKILFFVFVIYLTNFGVKALYKVRNQFQLKKEEQKQHFITDCMDVRSDEGVFKYIKESRYISTKNNSNLIDVSNLEDGMRVCGLFLFTEPDKIIEIHIRQLDIDCELGGLVSVFDGWEINGKYIPSSEDHPLSLEQRNNELCNDWKSYPMYRTVYQSNQNAALIQYRVPVKGSFTISVRHLKNAEPCNVLVQPNLSPAYYLTNYGHKKNCSIITVFPVDIKILYSSIGAQVGKSLDYNCDFNYDKLVIGGINEAQETFSSICGRFNQAVSYTIYCEYTTIRLISSGKYQNHVLLTVDLLDNYEDDFDKFDKFFCKTSEELN